MGFGEGVRILGNQIKIIDRFQSSNTIKRSESRGGTTLETYRGWKDCD